MRPHVADCSFYSDDEEETYYECSSSRRSSAGASEVDAAMGGLRTSSGSGASASGSDGEPDWLK